MTTNKREEYNIDDTDNSESVILTKPENNEMFSGDQLKKINIINQEILLPSLQEFIEIDHKKFNTTYKDSREVADNNNHYRLSKINEGFDIIEKTEEPEELRRRQLQMLAHKHRRRQHIEEHAVERNATGQRQQDEAAVADHLAVAAHQLRPCASSRRSNTRISRHTSCGCVGAA